MALVEFQELLPEILAAAPACPTGTMVRLLRNAAVELCERADCYRFHLDNEPVIAGTNEVELSLPEATVLQRVVNLSVNGTRLKPYSVTMLNLDDPEWATTTAAEPVYYLRHPTNSAAVLLYPIPTATYTTVGMRGEVSLRPSRTATGIEEIFLDRHQSALIDGALARILAIPSAPWYSPDTAMFHLQLFQQQIDDARRVADGDDMPKVRRIVYGGL